MIVPGSWTKAGRARLGAEFWVGLGAASLIAALSLLPMLRLTLDALDGRIIEEVMRSAALWRALGRSLETSLGGSVIALLIGGGFAMLIGLTNAWGRAMLSLAVLLPLLIPSQIIALAWLEMFHPVARLAALVGIEIPPGTPNPLYSPGGIMLLLGVEQAPIIFLAVRAALRAMPSDLIEAAQAAGARPRQVLFTVIAPLMAPAVGAGFGLAFVACLGNFGIPALLGIPARYPTLPVLIYQRLSGFGPSILGEASVMALTLGIFAAAAVLLVNRLAGPGGHALVGSSGRAGDFRLPLGNGRAALSILAWGIALFMTVLPLLALAATSVTKAYGLELSAATFTLDHYARAFAVPQTLRGLWNSFWLSLTAAVVLTLVAIPCAFVGLWSRQRGVRRLFAVLDVMAQIPYALPGVIVAIAAILLYLKPLPLLDATLYGTAAIILLAYLARFLPLALRPVQAALLQVDRVLDEAAQAAGAGYGRRLAAIAAPLILPSALAGALLVFLTAFNEITVSSLLWSRGNETIGVAIFFLEESGDAPGAAAVSVICMGFVFLFAAVATWLLPRPARRVLPWC
ncbi:MAG: ABC transporter permease [Elstera sp.]